MSVSASVNRILGPDVPDAYRQHFKAELVSINTGRMLLFCTAFLLVYIAMLALSLSRSEAHAAQTAPPDVSFAYTVVYIVGVALAAVFIVLFYLAKKKRFRNPRNSEQLIQAGILVFMVAQLLLCCLDALTGQAQTHYLIFVIIVSCLPVLPRSQSLTLVLGAAVFLLAFSLAIKAVAATPAWFMDYLTTQAASGALITLPLVTACGLFVSLSVYGMIVTRFVSRVEAEVKDVELARLTKERVLDIKSQTRRSEMAYLANTRLLTRLSRELRTPLSTIIGMTYMAKNPQPETRHNSAVSAIDTIDAIDRASQQITEILNSLLDSPGTFMDVSNNEDQPGRISPVFEEMRLSTDTAAVDVPDLSGKNILLVEDIEVNRIVMREFLKSTKATIDEAENGKVALEMFANSPVGHYIFIFMDLLMPKMNGYDATRAIRKLDREDATTVPIVAVSANAFPEDIEESLAAGMDAHLAKPVDFGTVIRTINQKLG
ncbi:MAG: response regulator [Coriobacteriales bacterium]|jgi:CheY-like chemotaxis protein|nr:response regulator [Coriobacteriales bacterium]